MRVDRLRPRGRCHRLHRSGGTGLRRPGGRHQDVIALSWNGTDYTPVIGGSFVGVPVAVPGDSATRTLLVRNDGPSAGTLNASIVNVKILDPSAPDAKDKGKDAKDQGNFYDDLRLAWNGGSANFTTLASRAETEIVEVDVAQGQTVPITIDYRLPIEATSGNRANVSAREASFDVRLSISGDHDRELPGTETAAPPTDPAVTPPSEDPRKRHPGQEQTSLRRIPWEPRMIRPRAIQESSRPTSLGQSRHWPRPAPTSGAQWPPDWDWWASAGCSPHAAAARESTRL